MNGNNNPWGQQGYGRSNPNPYSKGAVVPDPAGAYGNVRGQVYGPVAEIPEQHFDGSLGDSAVVAFTKRVYAYFTGALLTSTAACVGGMYAVEGLVSAGQGGTVKGLAIASMIGFFGTYLAVIFMRKNHSPMKVALLFAFATCAGFMTTPLVSAFVGAGMGMTVVGAFGIAATTFFGLTVYTLTTGRDFRSLGGMLMIGLFLMIGLILLNIFVPFSGGMHRLIVMGGIVLFIGFILFDTSMVTRDYFHSNDAISAAIQLFYDFFALFRYVLILLGDRR